MHRALFWVLALLLGWPAVRAAEISLEAVARQVRDAPRRAIVFSDDGAWRVHQSAAGELVREPTRGGGPVQRLHFSHPLLGLATRGTAQEVWLELEVPEQDPAQLGECLLRVRFGDDDTPPQTDTPFEPACLARLGLEAPTPPQEPARAPQPLALSSDGSRLAREKGRRIEVLDLQRLERLQSLPAGPGDGYQEVLQDLRFEDGGARLRVLTAVLGINENDTGSDSTLLLSRWDVASGALWHEAERPGRLLRPLDFAQAATATHQFWLHGPHQVVALNLQTCPSRARRWALPRGWQAQALAADPQGRWLAVQATQGPHTRLLWLDARQGRRLAQTRLRVAPGLRVATLQAHAQGVLWRAAPVLLPGEPVQSEGVPLGDWQHQDLPAAVAALAPVAPAGASALCRSPGEPAQARQMQISRAPAVAPWRLSLDAREDWSQARSAVEITDEGESAPTPCNQSDWEPGNLRDPAPDRWGFDPQGRLWIDQGDTLQRIDLQGQEAARWPTPRTREVCSVPSFERAQFLNWAGDTLSLQPFVPQGAPAATRRLVRRPGWQVQQARWLGSRVLVRWVRGPRAELNLYGPQGAAGWVLLARTRGSVDGDGRAQFEGDDLEGSAAWERLRDRAGRPLRWPAAAPPQAVRWQWARYQSAQARQGARVRAWAGVAGTELLAAVTRPWPARLVMPVWQQNLGEGRAVLGLAGRPEWALITHTPAHAAAAQVWEPPVPEGMAAVDEVRLWPGQRALVVRRGRELERLDLPPGLP